jgi:hypothetical protein
MIHAPEHPTQRLTVTAAVAIQKGQLVEATTGQLATEFSQSIGVALTDAKAGESIALGVDGEVSVRIADGIRFSGTAVGEYAYDTASTDLYLGVGTHSAAINAGTDSSAAFAYASAEQWAAPDGEGVAPQFVSAVIII